MTSSNSIALVRLTRREREVLVWVGDGMSNKAIARRLGLSVGTVKQHVHSILQKTGARTRCYLVAQMSTRSSAATVEFEQIEGAENGGVLAATASSSPADPMEGHPKSD
jgi:DNA-binding CsgD family transcriptional regulator